MTNLSLLNLSIAKTDASETFKRQSFYKLVVTLILKGAARVDHLWTSFCKNVIFFSVAVAD